GNSDPLVPPAEIDASIPEAISEVIMKAMELRREHRYDSASIMRQVLSTAWQRSQNQKAAEPKARPVPEPLSVSEEKTEIVETHSEAPKQETAAPIQRAITSTPVFSQPQPPAQTIDEGLLLEVEPAKNADDDFEWSIDVSEQPVKKAAAVSPRSTVDPDVDFNLHSAPASNMKFVMAGAGALILV